jgi:hypothetical protein
MKGFHSRKRNKIKRKRKRTRRKRNKIIKGGGLEWKGFRLDSDYDSEKQTHGRYNLSDIIKVLESYPLQLDNFYCPYIDIFIGRFTDYRNMIFYGPNGYIAGFIQYNPVESRHEKLIWIDYLCCWFSSLVENGYETKITDDYSAGQIMMAMTISDLSKTNSGYKIWLTSEAGAVNYYKSCGFTQGEKNEFSYDIKPDLDVETVLKGFTKKVAVLEDS